MEQVILDYLTSQKVSCLTVLLPDGNLHGAALHFSHGTDPLEIYFSTENTSKKCSGLVDGGKTKASCVLGFSEQDFRTLQMDGEVQIIHDQTTLTKVKEIHYAKHPSSKKYEHAPETVFLKFTPTWWRYTDYQTKPLTTISSN